MVYRVDILSDNMVDETPGASVHVDAIPASELSGASGVGRVDADGIRAVVLVAHLIDDLPTLDPATVGAEVIAALEAL